MLEAGHDPAEPNIAALAATEPRLARLRRRLISVPAVYLLLLVTVALSPVLFLGVLLFDLVTRRWGWPTVHMLCSSATWRSRRAAWWPHSSPACRAPVRAAGASSPGTTGSSGGSWADWPASGLVAGLRFEVDDTDADLSAGPMVALSRHVSIADALLPALVLGVTASGCGSSWPAVCSRTPCSTSCSTVSPTTSSTEGPKATRASSTPSVSWGATCATTKAAIIFPEGALFRPERRGGRSSSCTSRARRWPRGRQSWTTSFPRREGPWPCWTAPAPT